ncbi:hypothetical protein F1188_04720 [Roseospira marina]|uniref:Uncharacterized protein n=1 Tax=Roseospira marina TaxID=140057 RepID=A0A5M6IEG5_9PROT|nr:hypothetical protein F1188_04720 [Roseospira marina]
MSLSKVLFTVLVVVVVWGAFKYYSRAMSGGSPGDRPSLREKVERAAQDAVRKRMGEQDARAASSAQATEDLVRCPKCGAYHPAGIPCDCGYGR